MGNIVILVELKANKMDRQIKQGMAWQHFLSFHFQIYSAPQSHQFQLAAMVNNNNDSFITQWIK